MASFRPQAFSFLQLVKQKRNISNFAFCSPTFLYFVCDRCGAWQSVAKCGERVDSNKCGTVARDAYVQVVLVDVWCLGYVFRRYRQCGFSLCCRLVFDLLALLLSLLLCLLCKFACDTGKWCRWRCYAVDTGTVLGDCYCWPADFSFTFSCSLYGCGISRLLKCWPVACFNAI